MKLPLAMGLSLPFLLTGRAVLKMVRRETRTVNWAVEVASRLKGAQFPIEEDEARRRLEGMTIKGRDIGDVLGEIDFPVDTPAAMLHHISETVGKG